MTTKPYDSGIRFTDNPLIDIPGVGPFMVTCLDLDQDWRDIGHVPRPEPLSVCGVRSPIDAWPVLVQGGKVQGYVPPAQGGWAEFEREQTNREVRRAILGSYETDDQLRARVRAALDEHFDRWTDMGIPQEYGRG